ncbi:MAG: tetratricopeptide repeat protein [Rhodospirillales bacterium]|nr:tetratricopeptide repeat protein [Rhodospirillales bacterium]
MNSGPVGVNLGKLQAALAHHQGGRLAEAEALYRQLLADNPDDADASHYLGLVAHQSGRFAAAVPLITKALALRPDYVEAHVNLANALKALGRTGEAVACLRRALALRPGFAEGHANLGVLLKDSGDIDGAIRCYEAAIGLKPDFVAAHFNLANVLRAENRHREAIASYRRALAIAPRFIDGHINLGSVFEAVEDLAAAKACYAAALALDEGAVSALCNLAGVELALGDTVAAFTHASKAVAQDPGFGEAHRLLGLAQRRRGEMTAAADNLRRALEINPKNALFHNSLGLIRKDQEEPGLAIVSFNAALALNPDFAEAHGNLGNVYRDQERLDEARHHYQKALQLKPGFADAHNNYGTLLKDQGRLDEALDHYQKAVALKPGFADAHNNLGHCQLLTGQFAAGWRNYRWRWQLDGVAAYQRHYGAPLWEGSDLAGKTLFVHPEQGFGDFIQFVRYLPLLSRFGGPVTLEIPPALAGLYGDQTGAQRIIHTGQPPGAFDFHIPLLDLPLVLGTDAASIPPPLCRPEAAPELHEKWRRRLTGYGANRVGLVWAGNPDHKNDKRRSLDPALLRPLRDVAGVQLFSLQAGQAEQAHAVFGERVIDLAPELSSFADTAAAMEQLDLVISADSAPAHLAGALGVPVWTLLSFMPDWRWMMERDDSPWYPSMQLFRQPRPGDWTAVIDQVCRALTDFENRRDG